MMQQVPIAKLVDSVSSWNPKSDGSGQFSYIDLSSVDKTEKRISGVELLNCSEAPSRARQLVEEGDVLVATVRPNLNGVAMVLNEHDGMTASTGYSVLRPIRESLDGKFLFHWVKTPRFISKMVDVASGANYPAVSDKKIKKSTIPLPPLAEQKRIAKILDAADALRAKRRESLAQLDALLQSKFLEMFGDPVENPKGWAVLPLGSLAKFINGDRGSNYPSKGDFLEDGVPFINAGHLQDGEVDFGAMDYISDAHFNRLGGGKTELGDIIYCLRGSLGKAAIVRHQQDSAIASSLVILRPQPECDSDYLYNYLVSPFGRTEIRRYDNGSSQPNLSAASVKKFLVPVPPLDSQRHFAKVVKKIEEQKKHFRVQISELAALFASLQVRAFSDEL